MAKAGLTEMAGLMGEAAEAMAATQAMGLAVLRAEMLALSRMMPGQADTPAGAAARLAAQEAETEAGFDNMPV